MLCFGTKKQVKVAMDGEGARRAELGPHKRRTVVLNAKTKKRKRRQKNEDSQREKRDKSATTIMEMGDGKGPPAIDFAKITDRMFAILFASGSDSAYRQNIKGVSERVKRTFPDRCKIFNLSQKRSDLGRAHQQGAVVEFGWPETLAPPLDRLCSICKQIENHLNAAPDNVAVIHCKGGLYRAGIVVAAFMHYASICEAEASVADRFSMQLFTEKYLGSEAQPSHKRYVKYFANLLTGAIKVYPSPVLLTSVLLTRIFPGLVVTLKLYERMKPVWSSGKIVLKEHSVIDLGGAGRLSLRGDVLLKCYAPPAGAGCDKQLLFQCQFNTCALNLDSLGEPRLVLQKEELDYLPQDQPMDNSAALELCFELGPQTETAAKKSARKSASPGQQRKSASPGRVGGDFSRADSYENFDRAEDERSLSLPINPDGVVVGHHPKANSSEAEATASHHSSQVPTLPSSSSQHTPSATDGGDSGIGSDSPKASAAAAQSDAKGLQGIEEEGPWRMPPPVPPKAVRRHSSVELDDLEPDDPMRSAYEDSTIGRDHSVLPPGVRPNRRHSSHGMEGTTSASSGDEKQQQQQQQQIRRVCPMVQPELVATGRYDPNSRCFSYVPVKSLKEHYQAPKKPALKRRTSVAESVDLDSATVSPTEAQIALRQLHRKDSAGSDQRRRPETPKWEAEIDKVAGRFEPLPERRPRRASTSFTPVGHLQRDYVRSPSAQMRSPQEEWRFRQQRRTQTPMEALINGYYEHPAAKQQHVGEGWGAEVPQQQRSAHTVPRMQTPREMLLGLAERPTVGAQTSIVRTTSVQVVDQAKRATPMPAARQSPLPIRLHTAAGPAPAPQQPSPRTRQEMDELCDPEFYLSYTPNASPTVGRKQPQQEQPKRRPLREDLLSKSVPNDRVFRQTAQSELMRADVRNLLAEYQRGMNGGGTSPGTRRSQTPQNVELGRQKYTLPLQDEFRARNCRSVNSTPLIGQRKLFVHNGDRDAESDECGAEDWLSAKLRVVRGKRYSEPEEQRRNAERMLLEELKNKSADGAGQQRGGDPLEEYRREELRLKNAQSPLRLDQLRQANRDLQRERARQYMQSGHRGHIPSSAVPSDQPLQTIYPFSTFPRPASPPPSAMHNSVLPVYNGRQLDSPLVPLQHQNQPPPVRRGATPTSQIVRGKPPTPPPTMSRSDRERSKSPYSAKLMRGSSNSAPPVAAGAKRQQQQEPAVNASLYALRQSLYAKERERMGVAAEGGGGRPPEDAEDVQPPPKAAPDQHPVGRSQSHQEVPGHRLTPVKPILKRTNPQQQQNGWTRGEQTPPEESPALRAQQLLAWAERSDTPQFPISDRETPSKGGEPSSDLDPIDRQGPYHPLLYKGAEEHMNGGGGVARPHNNSNTWTAGQNRAGALTPHGMYGLSTSAGTNAAAFSRRSSLTSVDGAEVIHHHPVFMKDTSRFWYKPTISREEAIAMLKNKAPGTFIVRDSNSFPGAFGLALKVAQPPAGVNSADGSELVRHFLIEPSSKGVRLKGCSNEPVFGTLAALVYQHSITPLALPCRLILPEYDPAATPEHLNSNQALLERGAACNVTFLCSVDTESLTGPEALRRSAAHCLELLQRRELRAVPVHFKVSAQGITLTDNTRSQFFRRHYPVNSVTFAGIDPESRVFDNNNVAQLPPTYVRQAPVFGFVARKNPAGDYSGSVENACHLFAELDPDQPASAVVRFITNVMMPVGRAHLHQIHQSVR